MTQLHFIRHGQTESNAAGLISGWGETPLTVKGQMQAVEFGMKTDLTSYDLFYSSDLERAIMTLRYAGIKHDKITIDDRIRERHLGTLEGEPFSLVSHFDVNTWTDTTLAIGGGETFRQFISRLLSFIDDLTDLPVDKKILVCSHGGVLAALDYWYNSNPDVRSRNNLEVLEIII